MSLSTQPVRRPAPAKTTSPVDPIQSKIHAAAVDEPILTPEGGFVRMRSCARLNAARGDMGNVVIDQPVKRHDAPNGAPRDIRPRQEAPDPKLPGIRMGLVQVIDLYDQRQPDVAGVLGATRFVDQPDKELGLEPSDPGVDRRPRDLQYTHDADFGPPLGVEPDDLEAGVIAIRLGMVVHQGQLALQRHDTGLPDRLHRVVIDGMPEFNEHGAGEFSVMEPLIEGLESIALLPYSVRNGTSPPPVYHLAIRGQESRHALLPDAALEGAHRIWVGPRLLGRREAVRSANSTKGRMTS
jgi:hypothetical protein